MKATLEFNMPEDRYEFELATKAGPMMCSLADINIFLRNIIKHEELTDDQLEIAERIHSRMLEILDESGVEI